MFSKIRYINRVKRVNLEYCYSKTLGQTIKSYDKFNNINWNKSKDKSGNIFVTFSAELTSIVNFFKSENKNDTNSVITKILYDTVECKRNKKLFYESEDVLKYLRTNFALSEVPEFFKFDYDNSSVRIYIHFHINSMNKVLVVSSGYLINLKIDLPELGLFSCLFQDVSSGVKCLANIYDNVPINIHTSF